MSEIIYYMPSKIEPEMSGSIPPEPTNFSLKSDEFPIRRSDFSNTGVGEHVFNAIQAGAVCEAIITDSQGNRFLCGARGRGSVDFDASGNFEFKVCCSDEHAEVIERMIWEYYKADVALLGEENVHAPSIGRNGFGREKA